MWANLSAWQSTVVIQKYCLQSVFCNYNIAHNVAMTIGIQYIPQDCLLVIYMASWIAFQCHLNTWSKKGNTVKNIGSNCNWYYHHNIQQYNGNSSLIMYMHSSSTKKKSKSLASLYLPKKKIWECYFKHQGLFCRLKNNKILSSWIMLCLG